MLSLVADTWAELERELYNNLSNNNYEQTDVQFKLLNPLARLSGSKIRDVSYRIATGMFFWHMAPSIDVEELAYYNRRVREIKIVDIAHGYCWRTVSEGQSQWDVVLAVLKDNSQSREAIMMSANGSILQLSIRNSKLNMRVTSLQEDIVWGLTYDVFCFTLMQEVFLLQLQAIYPDLEMGTYTHASTAVYAQIQHRQLVDAVGNEVIIIPSDMMPITSLTDLDAVADAERALRTRGNWDFYACDTGTGLDYLFDRLVDHRLYRDAELAPHAVRATA